MAKIMLVEDDVNLQSIYGDRLTAEGHTIISARDGEEALSLAMKEKPDLIISDVMMPKISGFDMLDILRTTPETKDIKIIMMTALSQAEDKARADKLGADKYLVKSQVTLDDVARVVDEIVGNNKTPVVIGATNPDESAVGAVTDKETVVTAPEPVSMPEPEQPALATSRDPVIAPPETTALEAAAEMPAAIATETAASPPAVSSAPVDDTPAMPATAAVDSAEEAVAEAESATAEAEQATVSNQIDDFLSKNLPDTPIGSQAMEGPGPAPEPGAESPSAEEHAAAAIAPEQSPAPAEPAATSPIDVSASDSKELEAAAAALENAPKLTTPAPAIQTPAQTPPAQTPPATAPSDTEDKKVGVGERVIQPSPDFDPRPEAGQKKFQDLIDRETAKEIATAPVPTPSTGTVIDGVVPQTQPPAARANPPSAPNDIAL